MNREFFTNILFLILVNVLIKPLYIFGIDRSVQNRVGEAEYGVYFTITSFTVMLYIINDLGIQNYNSREIARYRHLLDKYFSNILVLKTILAGVYLVIIFIISFLLGYDYALYPLIFYLALNQIFLQFLGYLRSNVAGLGFYKWSSLLTILDKVLLLIMGSILLWVKPFSDNFDLLWFVHAQNLTLFLTCSVAFILVFKQVKTVKFRFNKPFLLVILRGSLPYALSVFLMGVYTRTDVVMLERFLPDGKIEAGIYASAYRLLDAVNVMGFLFSMLLWPMFSRLFKEGESVRPLLRLSFQVIMTGAVTFAVATGFHRAAIMHVLYTKATAYSGDVLGVLMMSFVAVSGMYIYSALLGANGRVRHMNILFGVAIVINIVLNILLISHYKALGAAISTLTTQFFVMFGLMFLSQKMLLLPEKTIMERGTALWISKLIGFILSVFLINFLVKSYFFKDNWLLQMGISMASCFMSALALGLLNYKKVKEMAFYDQKLTTEN
jgi:O-antigen/teichoic acid export membrane protein